MAERLSASSSGDDPKNIDFTNILANNSVDSKKHFVADDIYDFELDKTIDRRVIIKKLGSALKNGTSKSISIDVVNTDRSVGTLTGAEITRIHGENVLADDTFTVKCTGSGGQSFGAFIPKGLTLELSGDSNDYFLKQRKCILSQSWRLLLLLLSRFSRV